MADGAAKAGLDANKPSVADLGGRRWAGTRRAGRDVMWYTRASAKARSCQW